MFNPLNLKILKKKERSARRKTYDHDIKWSIRWFDILEWVSCFRRKSRNVNRPTNTGKTIYTLYPNIYLIIQEAKPKTKQ